LAVFYKIIKQNMIMSLRKVFSMFLVASIVTLGAISCKSKVSDADLKTKVEAAVSANPSVMVDVKDGVVTLSGTVSSDEERTLLENSDQPFSRSAVADFL